MDLTFTLADLTATSACELRLYTELRERAQKQSAHPTHEKLERAREAYRECLRVLTEGGMVGSAVVGSGVVSSEHAGGTPRPVPLVATSAAGLTYTVELDRLEYSPENSTAESNTARIVCTPHLSEAAHRALLRGALAAHLLTASATESAENTKNAARLDLHLEHGVDEYSAGSESEPTEYAEHHSPVPQPHRVDSARILPLIRLQEQRLLLLTEALNEGVEPAELAERIPYFLTCDECPACLNAAASLALATDAPELVTEDTAEDTAEDPATEEHPVMYRVPAAVENDSEQYRLQCLLDAQLASLEEHAAEHGWGTGELEAAMLLSMTNYHRRERAPFWREHIRRLEDGPTAWVASRDYAYLDRVQVLSVEHAHALLNTPADLEALAAAMKEPAEVEDAPGWYRVRGAQVRLLRARIEADPSLVIAPSDRAVFCAYEAGLSPQIALDRMESQVNYFRASNPGERVPAELAATGFFGMRVLAVAQGGFRAGSEGSADPEEAAPESGKSTGESAGAESAGEFLEVLLQERIRVKDEPHRALPSGIGPGDPVSTATIEAALQSDVHGLLFNGALMPSEVPGDDASDAPSSTRTLPSTLPSVVEAAASLTGVESASADLLFRRAPRLKRSASNAKNAENLPLEVDFPGSDLPTVDAVHAAVRALDHSYVAVQGPPGAGKTFLASHVIARLVAEGAKVGVVAQSHAVIENLMLACCARDGFDVSRAARLRGKSVTPDAPWSEVSDSELVELISSEGGLLFGGTVWDYVSERRVPTGSLDVLVVDEAGQFSLTNTVAAARAARSVLLLGDPQQLPQVSTGVHPYPVDVSALGWLSDGAAALDPHFGYFLGESWRMDSALCERVSWLSYDGALASAAATAGRALQGVEPGVVSYPVEHAGCSVRSVQEAQAVVDCVRELLGSEWVPAAGAESRPLAAEDCIVVAAYNAQVDCVREALIAAGLADSSGAGVRVGTVDKFQGQEAAVVLVSLASSRVDSGRGAGFVLSPNRLNVAVSRGQWQAVLVHSPWVARSVPQDVEEVLALSGFAGLVE